MMPGLTSPQETSVLCMDGIVCQMTALAQSPFLGVKGSAVPTHHLIQAHAPIGCNRLLPWI
jgi:hypothetical protein